jgi:hypothetical protein
MSDYVVVRPQLAGSLETPRLVCKSDGRRRGSLLSAQLAGQDLGHDDFWIAECDSERQRVLAIFHSDGECRTEATNDEIASVAAAVSMAVG